MACYAPLRTRLLIAIVRTLTWSFRRRCERQAPTTRLANAHSIDCQTGRIDSLNPRHETLCRPPGSWIVPMIEPITLSGGKTLFPTDRVARTFALTSVETITGVDAPVAPRQSPGFLPVTVPLASTRASVLRAQLCARERGSICQEFETFAERPRLRAAEIPCLLDSSHRVRQRPCTKLFRVNRRKPKPDQPLC